QAPHYSSVPGHLCPSSRVRSLRPDRRISPDERDRATGEPRTIVYPGIESPGCARLAVALPIPCADVPEIVDGLVTGHRLHGSWSPRTNCGINTAKNQTGKLRSYEY